MTTSRGKTVTAFDYEAFIRPDRNAAFQVLPVPLFMVQMDKNRDSIYVCAHVDSSDSAKNLTVVYFLRYGQIRPITPMPLPLTQIGNLIWGPVENTPLIVTRLPLTVFAKIQSILMHAFSDLTRIGVDRVRITSTQMELVSGGDLTQFNQGRVRKVIPLK